MAAHRARAPGLDDNEKKGENIVGDERRPDHPWSATTGIAEVNGAELYYEMLGTGHPLVLIHAEGLDRRMWDDQFTAFAERYQVIRYDLPGYGKPEKLEERRLGADTLLGLLKSLKIEKAYVLGSSEGGAIALDFTIDHPHAVGALILAAPGLGGICPAISWNSCSSTSLHCFQSGKKQCKQETFRAWSIC
jgi:pimeloyl-ACP methyl ester carboxylesterase